MNTGIRKFPDFKAVLILSILTSLLAKTSIARFRCHLRSFTYYCYHEQKLKKMELQQVE